MSSFYLSISVAYKTNYGYCGKYKAGSPIKIPDRSEYDRLIGELSKDDFDALAQKLDIMTSNSKMKVTKIILSFFEMDEISVRGYKTFSAEKEN